MTTPLYSGGAAAGKHSWGILILRRLFQLVPIAFGITLLSFFIVRLMPGDPARAMTGIRATPDAVQRLDAELGLGQPLLVQYVHFLQRGMHGDLGYSYLYQQPVVELVADRLLPTLWLVTYATFLSILIAVPLAIMSALRHRSIYDKLLQLGLVTCMGLPSYWLGILLLLAFGFAMRLFPIAGHGESPRGLFFLPALTLAAGVIPTVLRSLRASVLEVLRADHVVAARAKGLSPPSVLVRHVLPSALIPAIALLGVHAGWLVSGTMVVESLFDIPGLGRLLSHALGARDYPTLQVVIATLAILTTCIQLLTDMSLVALDPRASGDS